MVDIHCHILPEVDDGAYDLETAVEMVRLAEHSGVTGILATPHFKGTQESLKGLPYILRQLQRLQAASERAGYAVELKPGAEILCVPQTLELAGQKLLPTLGDSKYVLTEFYFDAGALFMEEVFRIFRHSGYIPVVAHPERYQAVQREPELVRDWIDRGCVIQVNKGSVLGAFGHGAMDTAKLLLRRSEVHVIASDAHGPFRRTTDLRPVRDWCLDHLGRTYTKLLLEENPERIFRGQSIVKNRGEI